MTEPLWKPIEDALRSKDASLLDRLGPAASDEDLALLENALDGVALPEDFIALWREHDGETLGHSDTLAKGKLLLPLRAIVSEYETMRALAEREPCDVDADAGVRRALFAKGWVPFVLLGGSSDFHCLDLDPADGGTRGQVIAVSHEVTRRTIVATDLRAYLTRYAEAIADGEDHPRAGLQARGAPEPARAPKSAPFTLLLAVAFWTTLVVAFVKSSKVAGFVAFVLWLVYLLLRFVQKHADSAD